MIGERINPTGRKIVLEALEEGNFEIVRQDAIAQVEAGATVLDVNAGVCRVLMKSPCCHK
jgi:5-methyltetrahydrofolate--homocysteine methyltransferase